MVMHEKAQLISRVSRGQSKFQKSEQRSADFGTVMILIRNDPQESELREADSAGFLPIPCRDALHFSKRTSRPVRRSGVLLANGGQAIQGPMA